MSNGAEATSGPGDPINPEGGQSAASWDAVVAGLPAVPDPWPPQGPIVLVAPHPDDELLGAGATLAAASDAGTEVRVVATTDGEMSHPHLSAAGRDRMVDRRLAETTAAYTAAGIRANRTRLSLSDGGSVDGASWEVGLAAGLAPVLAGAATCLVPWAHDGHPDHDACGRVARRLCAGLGVACVEFPIWSWNWDNPEDPRIPFGRAVRFDLPEARSDGLGEDLHARKQAGLAAYASQVRSEDGNRPVLPAGFLAHFARPAEVFLLPG